MAGDVRDLAVAVEQLKEETRLLRTSLDELRDDVVWAVRQVLAAGHQSSGTSPAAPRDPPFGEPTVDLEGKTHAAPSEPVGHAVDDGQDSYCCDRPKLTWNGDPDAPGVACENCGYVIADNGSVVIWRDEDYEPRIEQPKQLDQRQGNLF